MTPSPDETWGVPSPLRWKKEFDRFCLHMRCMQFICTFRRCLTSNRFSHYVTSFHFSHPRGPSWQNNNGVHIRVQSIRCWMWLLPTAHRQNHHHHTRPSSHLSCTDLDSTRVCLIALPTAALGGSQRGRYNIVCLARKDTLRTLRSERVYKPRQSQLCPEEIFKSRSRWVLLHG